MNDDKVSSFFSETIIIAAMTVGAYSLAFSYEVAYLNNFLCSTFTNTNKHGILFDICCYIIRILAPVFFSNKYICYDYA
jgi:hypothetical protein